MDTIEDSFPYISATEQLSFFGEDASFGGGTSVAYDTHYREYGFYPLHDQGKIYPSSTARWIGNISPT